MFSFQIELKLVQSNGHYKFGYKIVDKHGAKQSRSEEGDGWTKHGHYSLHDVDGRQRYVSYVADKKGIILELTSSFRQSHSFHSLKSDRFPRKDRH